jgi:NAD(P)-dependent dehydrogenase (short-subunit alcohol dehydrogenase family)
MTRPANELVALVTGSTDGIGKQTAIALARAGARVIVHGRGDARAAKAAEEIRAASGAAPDRVDHVAFDLGSLAAVKKGAAAIEARTPALHVLLNNAGIFANERVTSRDGHELTFAVNHLGPFLLTELLLPLLRRSAVPGAAARVINVSSVAHTRGEIHIGDLSLERGFSGYTAYAQSKLANIMHAVSLASRLPAAEVTANSLHPGVVMTKLLRTGFGPVVGDTVEEGAETPVYLATSPAVEGITGRYFTDCKEAEYAPVVDDREVRDALWQASDELTRAFR